MFATVSGTSGTSSIRSRRGVLQMAVMALAAAAALGTAGGCGHTVVPATANRPPTTKDQVEIYQDHPKRYEMLGIITLAASPQYTWDESGDANAGFDKLKEMAAAKGANGLLLAKDIGTYDLQAVAGYHGKYYKLPATHDPKGVAAAAIWVIDK